MDEDGTPVAVIGGRSVWLWVGDSGAWYAGDAEDSVPAPTPLQALVALHLRWAGKEDGRWVHDPSDMTLSEFRDELLRDAQAAIELARRIEAPDGE
jgi:hypothetical protein